MMDFFFFMKTLVLTIIVVLLLQIEVEQKTVENHIHDYMVGSIAAGFLGHAAHGGAHIIKDGTRFVTQKMRANIGSKHRHEPNQTKASRFQWLWEKKTASPAAAANDGDDGRDTD